MVLVRLSDDTYETVALENGILTRFPDEVWNIDIGLGVGAFADGFESLDYKDLIKMFRSLSRKLRSITICAHEAWLPDYLALLISACQSTDRLEIKSESESEFFDSDVGYNCLMNGLLQQDGPKTLHLGGIQGAISTYQAQILFEGVAHSSCLETLVLEFLVFEDPEAATNAFVNALRQNRSLKELEFYQSFFANSEEIFRAAVLDAKVQSIFVNCIPILLDSGFALDVLSSQACQLQSLTLYGVDMRGGDGVNNPTRINKSVNEVRLLDTKLDSSHLTGICTFKSATKLWLDSNNFNNLSPLDTLLIGDNLKLQHLSLNRCGIDESCIIEFFRKLPQMTCIRRINLQGNPFLDSHGWMDALSNAVGRNTSLDCISFVGYSSEVSSAERQIFYSRLEVLLSLNRAWKRFMENGAVENNGAAENSTKAALPSNLWPQVLERATKISYFPCTVHEKDAPSTLKVDVVFWLLRERMMAEETFNR